MTITAQPSESSSPAPLAVRPEWWEAVVHLAESLAQSSVRAVNVLGDEDPSALRPEVPGLATGLYTGFLNDAVRIVGLMSVLEDGGQPFAVGGGSEPGQLTPAEVTQQYLAGLAVGPDVKTVKAIDYGTGPEALPLALEALAEQVRGTDAALHPQLRLIAVLGDATPGSAGAPATAG